MRNLKRLLSALTLAALCAAPGWAAPQPSLQDVLARHAQALGGLDRLRALKALHAEATISAGGLSGKVRSYAVYPGRSRAEIALAFIRQTMVLDGSSAWSVDQNGQVKDLTGLELQNLQSETCVESFRYLLAPPGEVEVRFSTDTPESTQYINLEVRPAGGTPVQLCLDPVTYLVRKKISASAAGKVESYLSDLREVGGVKMPFHTVQMMGGDAAHAITVQTETAEALESLPDTLWQKPGASRRDWSLPAGTRSVSLPVDVYNHHVFLKVRANASGPLNFLLDTGAGATVIEKQRADALGLKTEGKLGAHGVGGSADYSFSKLDSLLVGGAVLLKPNAIIMDMSGITSVLGRPLDGILGYDFFSRFTVTVDYANKQLTLTEPGAWVAPARARALDLELVQNVPVVRAAVDGRYAGRFVVDTGNNSGLMLHGPFVRENRLLERATRKLEMRSQGAGGEEINTTVRMDSLVLAGVTVPRPLVSLSSASAGVTGGNSQLAGNIGGWILEKFSVTFDYAGRRMYLEPNSRLTEPMSLGRIGWQVAKLGGRLQVGGVPAGTPAAEAGVQVGDVLLKLEGQDITPLDVPALRHLTDQVEGTKLKFEIRRGEETRTVEVTLREVL